MSDLFADYSTSDIRALITDHPLAWVCATGDGVRDAAQLPLIGEYAADGRLLSLLGHLGRANPLCASLRAQRQVLFLFSGPSSYVSPEHAGSRDWAPTWNYANLRISADVTMDAELTDEALDVLIAAMERGRVAPWTREEIAHRYAGMAKAIIGFRATVTSIAGRFKFSQDERDSVYRTITERLPDREVVRWMHRLNPDR